MKDTINELFNAARQTGTAIAEKAKAAGQAAVDSTLQKIENWLEEFPRIESYGLRVTGSAFVMGIMPALEVEFKGAHADFPDEKISAILEENASGSLTWMVYHAVKNAYRLHRKITPTFDDPLIVKIRLSLSPEISVFVGQPNIR
ncbi:MAG: hypothetical protein H6575_09190 [Lewinellaceae bacterium]|nr:hypothetical protein [Lewinellaceae bacterium]